MSIVRRVVICSPAALIALLVAPDLARAQAATDSGDIGLQEVVVTAERRTEDIQKTPMTITAISGDAIDQEGKVQMDQVLAEVPGLYVQAAARGFQVALRGVGENFAAQNGENGYSVNFDDVYAFRAESGATGFFDLNRVEVVLGPQGTLYGRDAEAGVINVISNDPRLGEYQAAGTLELGTYDLRRGEGMINVPVTDVLALRVAFTDTSRAGYLTNGGDDDVAGAARVKALYKPNDKFDVLLGGEFTQLGGYGPGAVPEATLEKRLANPWTTTDSPDGFQDYHDWKVWLKMNWNVGLGVVTLIPSYQGATGKTVGDSFGGNPSDAFDPKDALQRSAELRLASEADSKTVWVLGLYHYDNSDTQQTISTACELANGGIEILPAGDTFAVAPPPGPCPAATDAIVAFKPGVSGDPTVTQVFSNAVFGQATYPITDALHLTGGARYTIDTKKLFEIDIAGNLPAGVAAIPNVTVGPFSRTWHTPDWKAALDYDLGSASLLYVTAGTGHRAGGFNQNTGVVFDNERSFNQETVTSYELGSKNRFLDNRLQLNGDVFYYQYKQYQLNDNVPNTPGATPATLSVYFNAPGARDWGSELEADFKVTQADSLKLNMGYLNTTIEGYTPIHPNGAHAPAVNLQGDPLPRAPTWTVSGTYQHMFILPGGASLTPSVDFRHSTSYYLSSQEQDTAALDQLAPGWWQVGAALNFTAASGKWNANVYVKNISNAVIEDNYSVGYIVLQAPRTVGVNISAKL
jgi:iron complex outermembrane receptor protein